MVQYVYVGESTDGTHPDGTTLAAGSPVFIIKQGSNYWRAIAILGYNDAHAQDEEVQDVEAVITCFEREFAQDRTFAAVIEDQSILEGASTRSSTEPPKGRW